MPINLPDGLPARRNLVDEGVELFDDEDARRWDIPPLRVALLNLMPKKIETEIQFARLIGGAPIPVELTLFTPDAYTPKTTPREHLDAFYKTWSDIRDEHFDGLIITGAPVETLAFENVYYWDELSDILSWARRRISHTLYICWAAQAALYRFHGVPKHELDAKIFGVFHHRVVHGDAPVLRGFNGSFWTPVSRHTEIRIRDIPTDKGLRVLSDSAQAGLCLVEDRPSRALYMFNHLEYDTETLNAEYLRDLEAAMPIEAPKNYFADDDPHKAPVNRWHPYAQLLFSNWIGEIYRSTYFDIARAA